MIQSFYEPGGGVKKERKIERKKKEILIGKLIFVT